MATNKNFVVKNGLEVGGDIIVTGSLQTSVLTLPASDGTSGQVIVTDGSGNLSFQTIVSNFTISDGTNTDTFNTGETLTFTAGTGITTTVSNNVVTIEGVAQYDDADAVAAIESHPHLTIDGGTLYVDTANDYVGIGDTSPQHKLDVAGAIGVNGTEVIDSTGEVITAQLKDSGVTAGSYGSASLVPVITVDAKGRITSASTTSVAGVSSFSYDTPTEVLTINTADGGSFNADISSLASQSYVDTAVAGLVDSAPGTLDTLNELAAALGDDPNFATTIATAINGKVDSTGDAFTGNVTFGDNNKAIFGAGSDLQIYHDGSYSYIDEVGTNDLVIRGSNNIWIQRADGTETLAKFTTDGACEFRYDNAPRLATTSTGVDVTGTITSDGLTLDGGVYKINNTSVGSGSDKWIGSDGGAGVFVNAGASGNFSVYNNNSLGRFNINGSTGDIMFLEDTGTAAKFFWDASAESLGIGTTSPAAKINTSGAVGAINSIQTQVLLSETGTNTGTGLQIKANNSTYSWDAGAITFLREGAANSYALTFDTSSGGTDSEAMRIDSSGRVGIATNGAVTDIPGTSHDTVVVGNNGMSAAGVILNVANGSNSTFGFYDNTGTTPAARMLWDSSADKLHFYTRNSSATGEGVRMTIRTDGNVGIGTESPASKLHIKTSTNFNYEFEEVSSKLRLSALNDARSANVPLQFAASEFNFISGNVGIGTDSPATLLNVRAATNHTTGTDRTDLVTLHQGISAWSVGRGAGIRWVGDTSRTMAGISTYVFGFEDTGLAFETGGADSTGNLNPTTRMVIDHNGYVGIGNTDPSGGLTLYGNGYGNKGKLFVYGGGDENSWSQNRNEAIRIGRGDIKDSYYHSIWSATGSGGDTDHWLRFYLNNGQTSGTSQVLGLQLDANKVAIFGGGQEAIAVQNTNRGVTINGSGEGRIYATASAHHDFNRTVAGEAFRFRVGTTVRGSIYTDSSGTTYNTTSDRRLKDNITTITNGKEKLLAMNPVTHSWKADPDAAAVHGFIAQEMQEVVPEAISGDPESDEMMSMDYGRITPVIVAALQDALKEIEELKTRIKTLEAK